MQRNQTRRRFVVTTGTVCAGLLAGCSQGDSTDTPTDEPMDDDMPTPTEDGMSMPTDDGMATPTEGGMSMPTDDGTATPTEGGMATPTEFVVRVENVSTASTLPTSEGGKPAPVAPVAYAVHEDPAPLFEEGTQASAGLERLAEDGSPTDLVSAVSMDVQAAGAAAVPMGADEAGPIGPGGVYEFSVEAVPGQRLSLASMFVQSNDLFYAPEESGIALFEMGSPIDRDVTTQLVLWDAGTEENQEPGVGSNQAPRQSGTDTGPAEGGTVRRVGDVDDGFDYPATADVLTVTVSPAGTNGGM